MARRKLYGKPVVDAKKAIDMEITDTDIKKGNRRSQSDCAAALAVQRCIPGAKGARICLSRSYIEFADKWMRFMTPRSLRSEMIVHDRDGKFEAGEYYLTPPPASMRGQMGKAQGGKPKPKPRDRVGKHRRPPHHVHGVRAKSSLLSPDA